MYCGRECYSILNIPEDASLKTIRSSYRKLSLKYHPDKNPDANASTLFRELATAYEILSDVEKREMYDHYIQNPEDYAYNYGMYYTHVYAPQSDIRLVLFGFILILSAFQHASQVTRYQTALTYFRASDTIKRKALLIQEERYGAKSTGRRSSTNDKKRVKKQQLEDIISELMENVEITGGYSKPDIQTLLLVRLCMSPWHLILYALWYGNWIYSHTICRRAYSRDEKIYLLCKKFGIRQEYFESEAFTPEVRGLLLKRELWTKRNYTVFTTKFHELRSTSEPKEYKLLQKAKGMLSGPTQKIDDEDSDDFYESDY